MTPAQRKAVTDAQVALFAAQDTVDEEQAKMIVTNQAMADAQNFIDRVLPVQQQQQKQQAIADLVNKQNANTKQFEITSAAYVALDAAQVALENAIRAARQTGAVEQV